jgi:hypothetical protein
MKNSFDFKKLIPSLIAVVIFLGITFIYFSPVLSGKTLSMHDINMASGGAKELQDYHEKTGEWVYWTNSMFGGMPSFMIVGDYPYSLSSKIGQFFTNALPAPANVIFLLMVGFYILMVSLRKANAVAIIASIAYAFGTYNFLYTEAGHISKILALAYCPALLAGFVYIFRGKYLLGAFLTALFFGLELYANHLQITYYFAFILIAFTAYEGIKLIQKGELSKLGKVIGALAISVLIGIGMNGMRLWNNLSYSAETTRGKSELKTSSAGTSGLDRDYAFGWSYGIDESFNLMFPDIMGGGSSGSLGVDSDTYKTLTSGGVDAGMAQQFIGQLPLYHGNQSFTTGPSYSGIIVIFLFILGLFLVKNKFKWVTFGLTLFFLMLSWGSNFPSINNIIYDYLPGYNKFRAVTMTLTIVHFLLVFGAANTLSELFEKKFNWEELKKSVFYSLGTILALAMVGYFSVSFSGANDATFKESLTQSLGGDFSARVLNALVSDRESMAIKDIQRGLILVLLCIGLIYLFSKQKIKHIFLVAGIALLLVFDMFGVNKRYFNNDDFMNKNQAQVVFEPTAADLEIMKDPDPNYKVINLTTGFWSDARDSYFHKSIGGYHGAKLKKIQELYDYQMTKDGKINLPILNMLNTKYLIVNGPDNKPMAQRNPDALGHAWFVDSLVSVPNADVEIELIGKINPKNTAVAQENQKLSNKVFAKDSANKIVLSSYKPNELVYETNTTSDQFAVFPEIYYRGNIDWISTIDGQTVDHQKVDYTLRGIQIPKGKHEVKFVFKPKSVDIGGKIDLAASIGLVLLGLIVLIVNIKK